MAFARSTFVRLSVLCVAIAAVSLSTSEVLAAKSSRPVKSRVAKSFVKPSTSKMVASLASPAQELAKRIGSVRTRPVPSMAIPAFRPPKPIANRHYAVDGVSFYANGRHVKVEGLDEVVDHAGSGVAKQRLQQALDSGEVSIEPVGVDGAGTTLARVRINGREVREMVTAPALIN